MNAQGLRFHAPTATIRNVIHDSSASLDKEAVQSVRDGDIDGSLPTTQKSAIWARCLARIFQRSSRELRRPYIRDSRNFKRLARTGSSNPNVQNVARGEKCMRCRGKKQTPPCERCAGTGAELGARECFIPRELMWDAATQSMQPAELVDSDYNLGVSHARAVVSLDVRMV